MRKIAICLMLSACSAAFAAEPGLPVVEILSSEFIYETDVTPSCHASTIEALPGGELVAAWFGGTKESADDVQIWLSRKVDGVWSYPEAVASDPLSACWNPVLFRTDDNLMLFYKTGKKVPVWVGHIKRSNDGGHTWGPDEVLPEGILGAIKDKPVIVPADKSAKTGKGKRSAAKGKKARTPDGLTIAPSSDESNGWSVHFELSSDGGRTWTSTAAVEDPSNLQAIQPSVIILPDGSLKALCRTKAGVVASTSSTDGGHTWSPLVAENIPNNNSGLDAVTLPGGDMLLVCNYVGNRPGKTNGPRTPISLLYSRDGANWDKLLDFQVESGEYSYPAIICEPDGTVHVTYTWKRQRIRHIALRLH